MFEQYTVRQPRRIGAYALASLVLHAVVIAALIVFAGQKVKEKLKVQEVSFVHAAKAPGAPPPPPPPPAKKSVVKKTTQVIPTHVDPKPIEVPKEIPKEEPKPKEEPAAEDEGEEGGVEGGQKGGVPGGVVGGQVGGVVGATGQAAPPPPPKNVPAFKTQQDALQTPLPRLSEVFKQSHRGQANVMGMYKVCVAQDGHVYDVVTVKGVPGADDDIIQNFKSGWLYKPQQVPVCFLYNMAITIQQ
jgi:protein TonB